MSQGQPSPLAVLAERGNAHDQTLVKFLRARDNNLKKAEAMLVAHLEWARTMRIKQFVAEWHPPPGIEKIVQLPFTFGEDMEGHTVYRVRFGAMDSRGLHRAVRPNTMNPPCTAHGNSLWSTEPYVPTHVAKLYHPSPVVCTVQVLLCTVL